MSKIELTADTLVTFADIRRALPKSVVIDEKSLVYRGYSHQRVPLVFDHRYRWTVANICEFFRTRLSAEDSAEFERALALPTPRVTLGARSGGKFK